MDSLAPSHLTSNTPVTDRCWCLTAFLTYLFSIQSATAWSHHLHLYVSSLLRENRIRSGDTYETLLQKSNICVGVIHFMDIVKTTREVIESISRQDASVTRVDFPYGYSYGTGKEFVIGAGSQQGIGLNHFMGQAKMSVENGGGAGGNLLQHSISMGNHIWQRGGNYALGEPGAPLSLNENQQSQMPSTSINQIWGQFQGHEMENVAGGSAMLLSPLGNYPEVKPTIINTNLVAPASTNINHVSSVQEATGYNYASDDANQPRQQGSQQDTQRPKRISWTVGLKLKFENAVAMLGGLKWATAKRIWRLMDDYTVTVRQVNNHLQRCRNEQKRIEAMNNTRHP